MKDGLQWLQLLTFNISDAGEDCVSMESRCDRQIFKNLSDLFVKT